MNFLKMYCLKVSKSNQKKRNIKRYGNAYILSFLNV